MSEPSEQPSGPKFENRGLWITAVSAVVAGVLWWQVGVQAAILLLASVILLSAIWLFWISLQALVGQSRLTLDEALGLAAPSAAEEQKRATLRILKDLEYERSVGKLSEEDYRVLVQHYRGEAKNLLRDLDDSLGPLRERAERRLAKRIAAAKLDSASGAESSDIQDASSSEVASSSTGADEQEREPDDSVSSRDDAEAKLDELAEAVEASLAGAEDDAVIEDGEQSRDRVDSSPSSDETSGVRQQTPKTPASQGRSGAVRRNSNPPPKPRTDGKPATLDGAQPASSSKSEASASEEDAQ